MHKHNIGRTWLEHGQDTHNTEKSNGLIHGSVLERNSSWLNPACVTQAAQAEPCFRSAGSDPCGK